MLIGLDGPMAAIYMDVIRSRSYMTPIDFGLTGLKGKVTEVTCKNVNMFFAHYHGNCSSQSFGISHADW